MSHWQEGSNPEIELAFYRMYREFFDRAEKKRRWSLRDDIPWHQCNKQLEPAIADVVESFCAVELYLPDYMGKYLPYNRAFRGRAWFALNWGYEESKHSLALGDWLLHSRHRTEEEMTDLEKEVFKYEWNLPLDSAWGMVVYSMVQELATFLHYRNLRHLIGDQGDPALYRLLGLVSVDERAHYDFFSSAVQMLLAFDRPEMLEQLRRVLNGFAMPAVHMLASGRRRMEAVKSLRIFDEEIYFNDVFLPILTDLGVERSELRRRTAREFVQVSEPAASVTKPKRSA
jgi:acyl-[acyl-carrier-protein] desaturase